MRTRYGPRSQHRCANCRWHGVDTASKVADKVKIGVQSDVGHPQDRRRARAKRVGAGFHCLWKVLDGGSGEERHCLSGSFFGGLTAWTSSLCENPGQKTSLFNAVSSQSHLSHASLHSDSLTVAYHQAYPRTSTLRITWSFSVLLAIFPMFMLFNLSSSMLCLMLQSCIRAA